MGTTASVRLDAAATAVGHARCLEIGIFNHHFQMDSIRVRMVEVFAVGCGVQPNMPGQALEVVVLF